MSRKELEELREMVEDIGNQADINRQNIDRMAQREKALKERVDKIDKRVGNIADLTVHSLEKLENNQGHFGGRLTSLEEGLKMRVYALEKKVAKLEQMHELSDLGHGPLPPAPAPEEEREPGNEEPKEGHWHKDRQGMVHNSEPKEECSRCKLGRGEPSYNDSEGPPRHPIDPDEHPSHPDHSSQPEEMDVNRGGE